MEYNQEKGVIAILDKSGKPRLVYSAPIIQLSSKKSITAPLEWDSATSTISIHLPEVTFPLVIAFGLSTKIPDVKGGFNLSFPSLKFKFGSKGEVEIEDSSSSSESEEEGGKKKKAFSLGFGLGKGKKLEEPKVRYHIKKHSLLTLCTGGYCC